MSKINQLFESLLKGKYKRITIVITISAIVVFLVFLGIKFYISFTGKTADIWRFVPEKTALILRINNVDDFQSLLESNQVLAEFDTLLPLQEFARKLHYFDSLFLIRDHVLRQWRQGQLLFLVMYAGSNHWEWVALKDLTRPIEKSNILKHLDNHAQSYDKVQIEYAEARKYVFDGDTFYFSIDQGVCVLSKDLRVVREIVERGRANRSDLKHSSIMTLSMLAGRTCIANLFIHYKNFSRLLQQFVNEQCGKTINFLADFAEWTTIDIVLNDNPLLMTGYTTYQHGAKGFLHVISDEEPQTIELLNALPSQTNEFIWLGYRNYFDFREKYGKWLEELTGIEQLHSNLINLQKRTSIQKIHNYFFPYTGNQLARFIFPVRGSDPAEDVFAIIKIDEPQAFQMELDKLHENFQNSPDNNFVLYRNYKIRRIPYDYFLLDLYGPIFNEIEKTWYTIYGNYFVVGQSVEALKKYLDFVISGKTLDKSYRYSSFAHVVTEAANIYLYFSPAAHVKRMTGWFQDEQGQITKLLSRTQIQSLAVQFILQPSMKVLTNIAIHAQDIQEESNIGWELSLDGLVVGGPWFVNVVDAPYRYIMCVDAFLNLYFFNEKGELIWKKTLPEQPIGKVWMVDLYKNNKIQYLLASENQVFLFDRSGNQVEGFPLKLPVPAAGPVSVFDYDNQKDYRIVYPGIDNKIHNITLQGTYPQGWSMPQIPNRVNTPVKHIRVVERDLLLVRDQNNKLYIFNRRGEQIIDTDMLVLNSFSDIYPAPRLCRGIVTSTADGQVVTISTLGQIEFKTIHQPGQGFVFLYADINNDGKEEFIFLEAGEMFIFQSTGELIAKHRIAETGSPKAGIIMQSPYGTLIYTFSSDGKEVFFAHHQGRLFPDMQIPASQYIDFYSSADNTRMYVLSSFKNIIYYTVLE